MSMQISPSGKVDRQTVVPFHLKLFYRTGAFHAPHDFPTTPSTPLPSHLQIYTWPTCTLRELSHLLTTALPSLLPSPVIGTRLSYRLVYPDTHTPPSAPGRFLTKDLGSVVVSADDDPYARLPGEEEGKVVREGVMNGRLSGDAEKTLQDARFVIGDYVDCAILAPGEDGGIRPPLREGGRGIGGGRGGDSGRRYNDFGRGRGGFGGGWDNGGGYRGRGGPRGGGFEPGRLREGRLGDGGVPQGEWQRGERVPEGRGGGGYHGGRGRGRGGY